MWQCFFTCVYVTVFFYLCTCDSVFLPAYMLQCFYLHTGDSFFYTWLLITVTYTCIQLTAAALALDSSCTRLSFSSSITLSTSWSRSWLLASTSWIRSSISDCSFCLSSFSFLTISLDFSSFSLAIKYEERNFLNFPIKMSKLNISRK